MAVSKVVLGNQTVMDITDSTVDAGSLLAGKKAYGANGEAVNGSLVVSDRIRWNEAKTSVKKNQLFYDLASLKSINTSGTWNDNAYTIHGITFTVNTDGSITANNTATAEGANFIIYSNNNESCPYNGYILSGCPNGGSGSTYDLRVSDVTTGSNQDYGSEVTISLSDTGKWNASILIRAYQEVSNLTFYPMIRIASIEDDTYVPYIPDNVELDEKKVGWYENGILGAKNLLSGRFLTTTVNDVTFTEQTDGSVVISSSGDTQNANLTSEIFTLKKGSYYLGKNIGSSIPNTRIAILVANSVYQNIISYDDWVPFTIDSDITCTVRLYVPAHTGAISNVKFEPMIRLASDSDDTYQPYAKTNKQLTDDVMSLEDAKNFHGLEFHSEYTTPVNANNVTKNGLYHYDNGGPAAASGASATNGALYSNAYSDTTGVQIAQDYANGNLFVRGRKATAIWSGWRKVMLDYHLDQSVTLSTSADTTVTFTDANIHADSAVEPWASVYGLVASNVVTTEGQCVVTFPKQDTAQSMTCRIYIK